MIPSNPAIEGGAGIGNLTNENKAPQIIPDINDSIAIFILVNSNNSQCFHRS